jgi:zinc/manganese transport system ATP-binding protein
MADQAAPGNSEGAGRQLGKPGDGGLAIRARELEARYGSRFVWRTAGLDIRSGEFVAILGPNGAGKSTLFRMLLGLLPPAQGTIEVLGASPHRGNNQVGYVPQRRAIDPDLRLRGSELVRLGVDGHLWGIPLPSVNRAAWGRAEDALDAVGAAGVGKRPAASLSGGELQRVLFAQAVAGNPRLLLLDEPLASLDLRNQLAIAELVADLSRSRGLTVLLIAHDVNPLLPFVDRVLYVAHGRLALGTPAELINSDALSRLYGAPIEVLRDSRGRVVVLGLEDETAHPHGHEGIRE